MRVTKLIKVELFDFYFNSEIAINKTFFIKPTEFVTCGEIPRFEACSRNTRDNGGRVLSSILFIVISEC